MAMYKYQMTIGLNDKKSHKQEIPTTDAKNIIVNTLLNQFQIGGFTMIDCEGCYTHQSGEIVRETSIRIEIATPEREKRMKAIVNALKESLNQESIMMECSVSNTFFI